MELRNENINLENCSHKNPFTVPDGYFEQFPKRLMVRIDGLETPPKPGVVRMKFLRPAIGIAASISIVAVLIYGSFKITGSQTGPNKQKTEFETADLEYDLLLNDISIIDFFTGETEKEPMNDATIETALLVSLNDYELYGYE